MVGPSPGQLNHPLQCTVKNLFLGGLPWQSVVKTLSSNAGGADLIPG